MTDSTPVPRFNWNEEIREYEDADGDECTYKTVVPASDFDRVVAEKNARIEKLEAAIKLQANAARNGMNAATEISRHQVETARRLRAESSPEALESERQANAILTSERDRLQAENVRLKGEVDSTNRALMNSGRLLGKNLAEIMILTEERDSLRAEVERLKELNVGLTNQCNTFNRDGARLERELTARDVRITELCQKVDSQCSVESVLALVAERDSLRAQLAAALAKVEEAERDAERYRWLRVDSPGSRVVA